MGLKIPHCGEISGKIEILSTVSLRCWKFAAVCWKIVNF